MLLNRLLSLPKPIPLRSGAMEKTDSPLRALSFSFLLCPSLYRCFPSQFEYLSASLSISMITSRNSAKGMKWILFKRSTAKVEYSPATHLSIPKAWLPRSNKKIEKRVGKRFCPWLRSFVRINNMRMTNCCGLMLLNGEKKLCFSKQNGFSASYVCLLLCAIVNKGARRALSVQATVYCMYVVRLIYEHWRFSRQFLMEAKLACIWMGPIDLFPIGYLIVLKFRLLNWHHCFGFIVVLIAIDFVPCILIMSDHIAVSPTMLLMSDWIDPADTSRTFTEMHNSSRSYTLQLRVHKHLGIKHSTSHVCIIVFV